MKRSYDERGAERWREKRTEKDRKKIEIERERERQRETESDREGERAREDRDIARKIENTWIKIHMNFNRNKIEKRERISRLCISNLRHVYYYHEI